MFLNEFDYINLGIMAHVDAGKTTLTESMLYTSGCIRKAGKIDEGSTVTDSMNLEKERGITIRSSTVSFIKNNIKINLIDTPGHMDFIAEVERVLAVLDIVILVISSNSGIQSQTKAIFKLLTKMKIPTLIFINKLDFFTGSLENLYNEIKNQLTENIIMMQDISISEKGININKQSKNYLENIMLEIDDDLQEKFIYNKNISDYEYKNAFKKHFLDNNLFPVLHGSASHHVGISELLEFLTKDSHFEREEKNNDLSAYVYKIDCDEKNKKRAFIRVFSGTLSNRQTVCVVGKDTIKIKNLYALNNGNLENCEEILPGDIGIIYHTEKLKIGDFLGIENAKITKTNLNEPFLRVSLSAKKAEERLKLINALGELNEEDPFLEFAIDEDNLEILISLFGQVQKEIIESLLLERFNIEVDFSDIKTIHKETPCKESEAIMEMYSDENPHYAMLHIKLIPLESGSGIKITEEFRRGNLTGFFWKAIYDGLEIAAQKGINGFAITDFEVIIVESAFNSIMSTPVDFRATAQLALAKALKESGTKILSPYLKYELDIPKNSSGKAYSDILKMHGTIEKTESFINNIIYYGIIPWESSKNYQLEVNYYTQGSGTFFTDFFGFFE